jgi:hypothetical protein
MQELFSYVFYTSRVTNGTRTFKFARCGILQNMVTVNDYLHRLHSFYAGIFPAVIKLQLNFTNMAVKLYLLDTL